MIINLFPLETESKPMYNYGAGCIAFKMNKLFPNSFTTSSVTTNSFSRSTAKLDNLYNTYSTDVMELLHYVIVLDIVAKQYGFSPQCEWWKWKLFKTGVMPV